MMFKNATRYSPDPGRFLQKEKQLRNYHIRNWLQMNRSKKEMLELSLNYFYGEQPKLLRWSLDIIDGDPKGLVVATIIRESKANVAQAEMIYEQLQSTVGLCRSLVEEISRNAPLSDTASQRLLQERVARAGVARIGYGTTTAPSIVIVNRPVLISACAVLLFLSAALTTLFVLGDFPGMKQFQSFGKSVIYIVIAYTGLSGWGYWNMKRWAVLLYSVEPVARFFLGFPHVLIAMPLLIAAFGWMHFKDMTWK